MPGSSTRRRRSSERYRFPALQANALYEGIYPLSTALARPLIAKTLAETAVALGADAVAHGCTGKGNDQVRFDVAVHTLAPELRVIAPVREWNMNREDEIAYAQSHHLKIRVTPESPYSVDENLWGRSIEGGRLEDANVPAPEAVFDWTGAPGELAGLSRNRWSSPSSGASRSRSTALGLTRSTSSAR